MVHRIATLTPVAHGHEDDVRLALQDVDGFSPSPFAGVPGTHVARLFVARRPGWPAALLGFSAVADVPVEEYLASVYEELGPVAEHIWRHCVGWPGASDTVAFVAWQRCQLVVPTFAFATWDTDVDRIRRAVDVRSRLIAFAPRAQDLHGSELRQAFFDEVVSS